MLSLSATTTDLQQNSSEQQSDKAEKWMSKMKLSFWRTNNTPGNMRYARTHVSEKGGFVYLWMSERW